MKNYILWIATIAIATSMLPIIGKYLLECGPWWLSDPIYRADGSIYADHRGSVAVFASGFMLVIVGLATIIAIVFAATDKALEDRLKEIRKGG